MQQLLSRKSFLILLIACLALTAVLGIVAVLVGDLGTVGTNVLLTTATIDTAALLGLCCSGQTRSMLHRWVQIIGLLSIAISAVISIYIIWDTSGYYGIIDKVGWVATIISVVCAHACLILPLMVYNRILAVVVRATLVCMVVVGEMIANYLIFDNFSPGDWYIKTLVVFLILDVLGTLLGVILRRATKPTVALATGAPVSPPPASTPPQVL